MPGTVTTTMHGDVGVVELVAPQPNYLDPYLVETLADAMETAAGGGGCRALVLCSSGRHFSAGADFGEDGGIGPDRPTAATRLYGAAARLFTIRVPVIAVVQGAAVGAGLGLACAADFRVAAPSSRFHANFTQLGFHPGFALSAVLPQIVGRQAASDLLYSGRRVDGAVAADMGLVDRLVGEVDLRTSAIRWAEEFARAAPQAVVSLKRTLIEGREAEVRTAMARELSEQTWLWETEDCRIGMEAAVHRRTPRFTGR